MSLELYVRHPATVLCAITTCIYSVYKPLTASPPYKPYITKLDMKLSPVMHVHVASHTESLTLLRGTAVLCCLLCMCPFREAYAMPRHIDNVCSR